MADFDTTDQGFKNRFGQVQPWNDPPTVTENERLLAGLSYLSQVFFPLILPIVLLLTEETKGSRFVKYHAVHSLALLAAAVLYYVAATFVFLLASVVAGCLLCIAWVIFLPPLVLFVYYAWQAFVGRAPIVPWLTEFLQDNNWLQT